MRGGLPATQMRTLGWDDNRPDGARLSDRLGSPTSLPRRANTLPGKWLNSLNIDG
jgi:hypothetical protein